MRFSATGDVFIKIISGSCGNNSQLHKSFCVCFYKLAAAVIEKQLCSFTFMHLADAFIQSDLQCIQVIHFH